MSSRSARGRSIFTSCGATLMMSEPWIYGGLKYNQHMNEPN
ncbi:uncharacterized protein HMPREF1541_09007 [Cyphellophora europaea CBS 101466]|uniref:Uncharacterized protein n=1 Tax=Cyphellophora europaea (strain CBS 101466) TaxID=1220924 RepID=W2RLX0_CYPE1|nr:uncharacterized protein HMPREF1541_09007 [Cyphellophora europaea CBS 101466]ETN36729.1 hypothetical protein HMPREF1541_09007 [Cyphellophora europaea CBS 101466]